MCVSLVLPKDSSGQLYSSILERVPSKRGSVYSPQVFIMHGGLFKVQMSLPQQCVKIMFPKSV